MFFLFLFSLKLVYNLHFSQIVTTLKNVEDIGVVHRDIRSTNKLVKDISETGKPTMIKIIDFGAAAFTCEAPFNLKLFTNYVAVPEWHSHRRYDGVQQTVWTLGLLLHEVVCGRLLFESSEESSWDQFSFNWKRVTKEFKGLVLLCLRRKPEERPTLDMILNHPWFSCKILNHW